MDCLLIYKPYKGVSHQTPEVSKLLFMLKKPYKVIAF